MNIFRLSYKNIVSKPLSTGLSLLLLAMGVCLISLMLQVDKLLKDQMTNSVKGIDMVVGAKGSPLQLILSAVFQLDVPTGNIDLGEAEKLQKNRLVEYGIPLSYGDSYETFRIVGTTTKYPELYQAKLSAGHLWTKSMEVTLGVKVAEKTGLAIGDTFEGSHGLSEGGHVHEEKSYVVTGIFEPTNLVIDQLILTGLESVWDIHSPHEEHEVQNHGAHNESNEGELKAEQQTDVHDDKPDDRQITALLIKFRNPIGLVQLPRMINEKTSMQAALPGYELHKLFNLLGIATKVLGMVALAVILVSGISVFISLYVSLKERTYEMALLRTYGASRLQLLGMVLQEGLFIAFSGFVIGMFLSRGGLLVIFLTVDLGYHYDFSDALPVLEEGYLLLTTLAIGFLSSLIPAIQVFHINLSKTLADA